MNPFVRVCADAHSAACSVQINDHMNIAVYRAGEQIIVLPQSWTGKAVNYAQNRICAFSDSE